MSDKAQASRERMVHSAAQLVRAQGVMRTGVRDVVAHAEAPWGSYQHYFPGGKNQLVGEAVVWAGNFAARWVAAYPQTTDDPSPAGLFAHMVKYWRDDLLAHNYERGCPVTAAAAELAGGDSPINEQLRSAANAWEQAVVEQLVRMDVPPLRARSLATLMLGALEGGILLARIRRDVGTLDMVVTELSPLLNTFLR